MLGILVNIYAIIQGINAVVALAAASIILFSKSRKPAHLGHGWFSLLLFGYTFPYFLWGTQTNKEPALYFLTLLLDAVCFIHTGYFHYTLILADRVKKHRFWLWVGYSSSFLLAILNHRWLLFEIDHIRKQGPFLFWPHATSCLPILIVVQCAYVLTSWVILWSASNDISIPKKINLKSYLIIGVVGWMGGLSNWFPFWDGPFIPPVGNIGVMLLVVGTFYLIFRHDFLELDKTVKKGFVYTLLTLFITITYTAFILIGERVSSKFFGYSSLISSVLAAATIAFLFNPVRTWFGTLIDKVTFGKNIKDLSEENLKFQLEMQKQDRLKATALLASGMAHEVKNPLAVIRTFTEYLPKKYDDPDFRKKFHRVLLEEVDRIDNIVRQLLDFSKPQPPKLIPLHLESLVNETLEPLNETFVKHKIKLIKQYSAVAQVLGDKNQLKQVFLNVFLNAVQAMPDGGQLTVKISSSAPGVLVSVWDTGCGIAGDQLKHIFEPFFTTKEYGTGLGLSIVKEIVEAHGAKISVESRPSMGTNFQILFNVAPPQP